MSQANFNQNLQSPPKSPLPCMTALDLVSRLVFPLLLKRCWTESCVDDVYDYGFFAWERTSIDIIGSALARNVMTSKRVSREFKALGRLAPSGKKAFPCALCNSRHIALKASCEVQPSRIYVNIFTGGRIVYKTFTRARGSLMNALFFHCYGQGFFVRCYKNRSRKPFAQSITSSF